MSSIEQYIQDNAERFEDELCRFDYSRVEVYGSRQVAVKAVGEVLFDAVCFEFCLSKSARVDEFFGGNKLP